MAIKPKCDSCRIELKEYGAILLGPLDNQNKAVKSHLCVDCYQKTMDILKIN